MKIFRSGTKITVTSDNSMAHLYTCTYITDTPATSVTILYLFTNPLSWVMDYFWHMS